MAQQEQSNDDRVIQLLRSHEEFLKAIQRAPRSLGVWDCHTKLTQVTNQKGKHWMVFGVTEGGSLLLKPEETLYLMEIGALKVKHKGGIDITLEEAYTLMLEDLEMEMYQVFSYLMKSGYVAVIRRIPLKDVQYVNPSSVQKTSLTETSPADYIFWVSNEITSVNNDQSVTLKSNNQVLEILELFFRTKNFKKTAPGVPVAYVIVKKPKEAFPSAAVLQSYKHSLPHEASLHFAIVDEGSISFLSTSNGLIPHLEPNPSLKTKC